MSGEQERGASEAAPSSRILSWSLLIVTAISLWVFRPVLANRFVNWDDQIYLGEVTRLGSFSLSSLRWMWTSLQPFYLQPIDWMIRLADYRLWGLEPMGHHATSWILHGVYIALVGVLIWMLTGKAGNLLMRERLALSAGIALITGIHPLQVETVAWVAARNGLLCSVWMVAALCVYIRAAGNGQTHRGWWWTTMALQAAALLTKPFAVSLPVVMLALDFFPLRRHAGRSAWRLVGEKWLMFAMSVAAAVGAVAAQQRLEGITEYALGARMLVASRGVVFYLWKLVWPAWLSPFYPLGDHASSRSMEFLVPMLFCMALTGMAVWQRKRAPVLLAAWWSYLALLLPVLGLVQVGGQSVADRYAYLAMVPVLLALGSAVLWTWRHGPMVIKTLLCIAVSAWLVFLGLRTRGQIAVWHDDLSLWGAALTHFPNDPLANYNLALALVGGGRLVEARAPAERAVTYSDPHAPQLPLARATLGAVYLKTHAYNQAVEQLQQAVAADATLWAARYNLACAYARLGRLADACEVLQNLLPSQPQFAQVAVRDAELSGLRTDPAYGKRFRELIGKTDSL